MKAAVLYSYDDVRIEDIGRPRCGAGEAVVRTIASGICSGDVMPWYIEKKAPLVIGHEPAGVIVEVGSGVTAVRPGDRVYVHHHAPCHSCPRCEREDHVQCETWRTTGIDPGGVAEYFRVPATNLAHDTLVLPKHVSFEEAVLIEPLACVLKGLSRVRFRKSDTALVIGLGIMGQLHIAALRLMGVDRVIGVDRVDFRMARALEAGAMDCIDLGKEDVEEGMRRLTEGAMAQLVIVGPASVSAMESGIRCAGVGATVLFFSPASPGEKLCLEPNVLYFQDISLVTSYSCGPAHTRAALEMIAGGGADWARMITHRFPIERTAEAFRLTAEGGNSLKSVITFQV